MKNASNYFEFEGSPIPFRQGDSVLQCLLRAKVAIEHSCGGNATCGTCRVFVENPVENTSPRTDLEQEFAQERGFDDQERLSCQLIAHQGLVVRRP